MGFFEKIFQPKPKEEQLEFIDKKGRIKKEADVVRREQERLREELRKKKEAELAEEKRVKEEAKKQARAEQLEFLGRKGEIKKEVEEHSLAAERSQEETKEIEQFLENTEGLRRYKQIEKSKVMPLLRKGRAFLAAEDIRKNLESEESGENFKQKVIEALPKEVRRAYEILEAERKECEAEQGEIEKTKPEKRGLFVRLKEKIGGWWRRRTQERVEQEARAEEYERLINPSFYSEPTEIYE